MSKEQLTGNVFEKSGCNSDTDFLRLFSRRVFQCETSQVYFKALKELFFSVCPFRKKPISKRYNKTRHLCKTFDIRTWHDL